VRWRRPLRSLGSKSLRSWRGRGCGRHQFHGGPSRVATPAELPAANPATALLHRSGLVRSEGADAEVWCSRIAEAN
jgi:hypothetical protein